MDGSQSPAGMDLKRRQFTGADVQAMLEAGVLRHDERVELLEGELVEMPPQGRLHSELSRRIMNWMVRNAPPGYDVAAGNPFRLSDRNQPEPEIFVLPVAMNVNDARGEDTLLVVEISLSSLRIDLRIKAPIYEAHGVREYWVVDVENRQTLVHKLGGDGYGEPAAIPFDQPLAAPGGRPLVIADLTPKA